MWLGSLPAGPGGVQSANVFWVHLELKTTPLFVDVPVVGNTAFLPAWDV